MTAIAELPIRRIALVLGVPAMFALIAPEWTHSLIDPIAGYLSILLVGILLLAILALHIAVGVWRSDDESGVDL